MKALVPDAVVTIFIIAIAVILLFLIYSIRKGNIRLIHRLYFAVAGVSIVWMASVGLLSFIDPQDVTAQYVLDALSNIGGAFSPPLSLLIALAFVNGLDKMPKRYYLILAVPTLTNIMVWTNPLHHLMYQNFSILANEISFGPYMYFSGIYSYFCMAGSIILMLRFAYKSRNPLYVKQALLFAAGTFAPMAINCLATLKLIDLSIAATPLSMLVTILLHGLAIFHFHMLDIRPIALQQMLDWISDCYLVVNPEGLVVSCNHAFRDVFGAQYGIRENMQLKDCLRAEDVQHKSGLYNMFSAFNSCKDTGSVISYEQSVFTTFKGQAVKKYYVVDVTPLLVEGRQVGYVLYFRDVTKIKESMQRLQDSQARMMEQERLASLGQMVGGIAHNLKTPIMSISGSTSAVDKLIDESEESLGDPDVTPEDYREIYGEMRDWLNKVREACAYMSDIITAVKGQAATMSGSEQADFSIDAMLKRVSLLLRHELQGSGCKIVFHNGISRDVFLHGDINSMVQVINNLVQNAIDASKPSGGGEISIELYQGSGNLNILVRDHGGGVPPDIKPLLFRQMITSKGVQGTGLGVFISNSIIRAKFDGRMWLEDNPGGGSVFGISIPMDYVSFDNNDSSTREGR